jgi:hypothetical protein
MPTITSLIENPESANIQENLNILGGWIADFPITDTQRGTFRQLDDKTPESKQVIAMGYADVSAYYEHYDFVSMYLLLHEAHSAKKELIPDAKLEMTLEEKFPYFGDSIIVRFKKDDGSLAEIAGEYGALILTKDGRIAAVGHTITETYILDEERKLQVYNSLRGGGTESPQNH